MQPHETFTGSYQPGDVEFLLKPVVIEMTPVEKKEELTAAYSNTSRLENNSSSATTDLASDSKLSWQEQKEAQAKERKRANEFKKTEERIGVLEDRSAEIDILMAQEEVYTNSVKCQELAKERAEIDAELETLYEKWEELAE